MMDSFLELYNYSFFQNALLGVLLLSIASALIGTYIVIRRMVFISGGITHACFGGLGLGYFLGINPILMAAVFAVTSSIGVEWLSAQGRVREDTAIGVVWSLGMAVGTIFIFLTSGFTPDLNSFLFGNILTITDGDLTAFAIYIVCLLVFFVAFFRTIVICAFDRDFAATIHLPVRAINLVMTVAIAICIVLTIRLIGIMLLMSLFTLPQMTAELFVKRLRPMMLISVVVSMVCCLAGLICSCFIDVPTSAMIVVAFVVVYALARIVKAVSRDKAPVELPTE